MNIFECIYNSANNLRLFEIKKNNKVLNEVKDKEILNQLKSQEK